MKFMVLTALFNISYFISHLTIQVPMSTTHLQQPAIDFERNAAMDNKNLWKKIVARPDSVSLSISVNDTTRGLLVFSGKLVSTESAGSTSKIYFPETIKVFLPNRKMQVLKVKGNIMAWEQGQSYSCIYVSDINFDGYADIHVFDNAGATGNFWYSVWVFDANKKSFAFSEEFSEISAPKIDAGTKQLYSYYRFGACEEKIAYYKVKANKLIPVKYIYNEFEGCGSPSGCDCVTYKSERKDGKWVSIKINEPISTIYNSIYGK